MIALNWALRPSGVLRFATEEYDIDGWKFSGILNPGSSRMPPPLYQCTETESYPGGGGYSGNEAVHNTYYTYDPAGVLVTVTRVGGACGRLLVDYTTADIITDTNMFSFGPIPAVAEVDYTPVSGTLVFDDFEMSKTIVIPISPSGGGRYFSTNSAWSSFWPWHVDKDFNVVLSNARLDTVRDD